MKTFIIALGLCLTISVMGADLDSKDAEFEKLAKDYVFGDLGWGLFYLAAMTLFALGVLIALTVLVNNSRAEMNTSKWLNRERGNPEYDLLAIGQLLAAVLFILPLYGFTKVLQPFVVFSK